MFWREQGMGDEAVVRFTGTLDAASARDVKHFLESHTAGKVTLDLSQAAHVDYYGLSVLIAEIAESGRAVHLRGLDEEHVRVLRYLGLDPAQVGLSDTRR
jgi:anti-anti-sigma regulatory factor